VFENHFSQYPPEPVSDYRPLVEPSGDQDSNLERRRWLGVDHYKGEVGRAKTPFAGKNSRDLTGWETMFLGKHNATATRLGSTFFCFELAVA
jgi:hypothetical protein